MYRIFTMTSKFHLIKQIRNAVDLLNVNPDVSNIVGHSLGGAGALELQKNLKGTKT